MSNNNKKVLANLIKADLQDALTNDSRLIVEGVGHYFHDYSMLRKSILIYTDNNKELEKAVAENAHLHSSQRKEKWEKEKQKWGSREFNLIEEQVQVDELEPADYQEIISLISQVRKLAEEKTDKKRQWVEEKLSSNPKMVYWSKLRTVISIFKNGEWCSFKRKENGQEYCFYIPSNHPDLKNFPMEKEGFYLIDFPESVPLETYTEKDYVYWKKFLSLNDKITITPYETVEKPNKDNQEEEKNEKSKHAKEMAINVISHFFQEYNIKSIEITSSGDLLVEYNDGKSEVIKNDEKGTALVKNDLDRVLNKKSLDCQELEKLLTGSHSSQNTSPTNSPKSSYVPYYLVGGGVIIIVLGVVIWVSRRSNKKKKK